MARSGRECAPQASLTARSHESIRLRQSSSPVAPPDIHCAVVPAAQPDPKQPAFTAKTMHVSLHTAITDLPACLDRLTQ
jgi:hypothetical protein